MWYNSRIMTRLKHAWATAFVVLITLVVIAIEASAGSFGPDIDVLARALRRALGDETNTGRPRVAEARCGKVGGEDILVLVLNANREPLAAALRHGVLSDVAKTALVLKSWEWPLKVERVMISERLSNGQEDPAMDFLLFTCVISSQKIRETDWKSFNPAKIPDIAESAKFYENMK